MKFKNGSTIESIQSANNNNRGNRSNFITTVCYDTETGDWGLKTLDLREPIYRFIPEYMIKNKGD